MFSYVQLRVRRGLLHLVHPHPLHQPDLRAVEGRQWRLLAELQTSGSSSSHHVGPQTRSHCSLISQVTG